MFFYEVICLESEEKNCHRHTKGVLGGGYYRSLSGEAGFTKAHEEWHDGPRAHHPEHDIHVQELTYEEYSGRYPDDDVPTERTG